MVPPLPDNSAEREDAWLTKRLIPIVMIVVLVWGAILSAGAMLYSGERSMHPYWKGAIMLTAFLAFLAFWGVMLRYRARQLAEEDEEG